MASSMKLFLEALQGEQVSLEVGPDDNTTMYTPSKAILCSGSRWFDAAFKDGRFQESQSGSIRLPDDCPEAFGALLYYVHQDSLVWTTWPEDSDECGEQLWLCFKVWLLGDKYLLEDLQNTVMERICALLISVDSAGEAMPVAVEVLAMCYEACPEGLPLRVIIADHVVNRMRNSPSAFARAGPLASLPAFLPLLHSSETALHTNPDTFPRYRKPRANTDLLWIPPPGSTPQQSSKRGLPVVYRNNWNVLPTCCEVCGFCLEERESPRLYCKDHASTKCICTKSLTVACKECRP